uniref:Uncharacterized protein n=1 Tax=Rhizophora mucronata TaxID=61149 RepID=A0A2P2QP92_RHIMU
MLSFSSSSPLQVSPEIYLTNDLSSWPSIYAVPPQN